MGERCPRMAEAAGSTPADSTMPYRNIERKRAYQRERVAKVRADWIASNGPCACGSTQGLEVDHIDPALKVDHRVWSWSPARRAKELAKCQVLCGRCHIEKTSAARTKPQHGTNSAYVNLRCRCTACRIAHREANARYR